MTRSFSSMITVSALVGAGLLASACEQSAARTLVGPTLATSDPVPTEVGPVSGMKRYTVSGVITTMDKPARGIAGVHIAIADGPETGRMTTSGASGAFSLPSIAAGPIAIQISGPGYQSWSSKTWFLDGDMTIVPYLLLAPPNNASGFPATARCNDGTWSWAQKIEDACSVNGGIAYESCPGPFCRIH